MNYLYGESRMFERIVNEHVGVQIFYDEDCRFVGKWRMRMEHSFKKM